LCNPSTAAVRVWHAVNSSGPPGPIERACQASLDDAELARADQFRVATARNQHVIGRGMAKQLLGSDEVPPREIRFGVEAQGKPYVAQPAQARQPFNIAHTDGLVVCGIGSTAHRLIGVDVERLHRRTDPALAERYFSQPEVRYLRACRGEAARLRAFLRIWTLKEAFIKAIGTGLHTPLANFAFEEIDSDSPTIRILHPDLESELCWRFFSVEPRPGFVAAIAVAPLAPTATVSIELRPFQPPGEPTDHAMADPPHPPRPS
jgi:4'-phosphopantetheinyl transferase